MNTKRSLSLFLGLFLSLSVACSSISLPGLQKIETGTTETFILNEPAPGTGTIQDVALQVTVGDLTLSGGADALLEGEIHYNVKDWEPTIISKGNSLTVTQGERNFTVDGFPADDVVNSWDVSLGDIPVNLILEAGAYDARLDLSGIPLRSLIVQDGASDAEIRFDTLNPEQMRTLAYQTGASQITFLGLANANFTQMSFEGGTGEYTFDFSGDLQQDANVDIQVGLSNVKIVVPAGVSAQLVVEGGLGNIDVDDAWIRNGNHYENKGSGPQLTIVIELGAGSLDLTNE
ncbi:MAG TPA: toast rack family protein [Anaerolineales bacterium]|nr:toast rack family protein [Anaerolineales bacterium]